MKRLMILGAGQYGTVVKEIAEAIGYNVEFFDDSFEEGHRISNVGEGDAVVAIGNPKVRQQLLKKINAVTLIHPNAFVSSSAKIGKGCIIETGAVISSNAVVGTGTIVMSNAVVGHNAVVGDNCQLKYNCTISERSVVPSETKIECNEVFKEE